MNQMSKGLLFEPMAMFATGKLLTRSLLTAAKANNSWGTEANIIFLSATWKPEMRRLSNHQRLATLR